MGTLGTNTPYTTQDILNAAYGTIGGQAALQFMTPAAGSIVVQVSTFVAGSGATGTATASATGLALARNIDVFVNVTDYTGAATGSLLLFIDGRIDGTNYVNVAQMTVITTIGYAVAHLTKENPAGQVGAALSVDAGPGTVRAFGFGDAIRVRRQITGTATTTFTGAIYITNILA
jgi:hypothetical protein